MHLAGCTFGSGALHGGDDMICLPLGAVLRDVVPRNESAPRPRSPAHAVERTFFAGRAMEALEKAGCEARYPESSPAVVC